MHNDSSTYDAVRIIARIISIRISDSKANHIYESFTSKKNLANLAGMIDKMCAE